MDRRLFILGASAFVLSACGGNLIGPTDVGVMYVVRPAFAPASGEKVAWSLAILRPDVPGGLDNNRVALVQPDGTMDYYAKATYPDRLASTIEDTVVDGFENSGRIDAVAGEEQALHADYNLLVEVKDFSAHYAAPDGIPTVTVAVNAKLVTAHGRNIIASKTFIQSGPAGANSAAATVQGLQQGLGTIVKQVVDWTLVTAPAVPPSLGTASPGKPAEELLHDTTRKSDALKRKTPAEPPQ
jgi:cholesterol transport system auxiliary component